MFKSKHELQLMLSIGNNKDFELLETLIKDGWKIKKTNSNTSYFIHIKLER